MSKTKLSASQKNVIELIRDGWELGRSTWFGQRTWLQKDGIGKGGESKTIHRKTADALLDMGLIKVSSRENGRSFIVFSLTEIGKTIEIGDPTPPLNRLNKII